jgi:hypothetical protein
VIFSFNRFRLLSSAALFTAALWVGALQTGACGNSTGVSSSVENTSSDEGACGQECALELLTPCTCGVDDPCGFRNDGFCDRDCLFKNIVDSMFDDAKDCPGLCDGACEAGFYTACTCGADDPCDWTKDGSCDRACLENGTIAVMFDDSADCADAGL